MSSSRAILHKTAAKPVIGLRVVDAAGAARDITGWALSWRLGRLGVPGQGALIECTTTGGISITDGPNGLCEVMVTPDQVVGVPAGGAYTHELRRTDAGQEEVLGQGAAEVRASLSQ